MANWQKTLISFHETADMTEKSSEASIERAFKQLSSSESAFALVLKLKERGSKSEIIQRRYKEVLNLFESELDDGIKFFKSNKYKPPLSRRSQRTPGVIAWANEIYLRSKNAIIVFRQHEEILNSKRGEEVIRKYIDFAKEIDKFKAEKYDEWYHKVKELSYQGLQRPLLAEESSKVHEEVLFSSFSNDNNEESHVKSPHRIKTNFCPEVRIAMSEAKLFDAMGYQIPEILSHLAIQQHIFDG